MNSHKAVMAAFLGTMAIIMFRDFKNPDPKWPLGPVPPPYRFTWAGVAFGICALIGDMVNDKLGAVIAGGLFLGLAFSVVTKSSTGPGAGGSGSANPPGTGTNKSPVPGTTPQAPKFDGPTVGQPKGPIV